MIVLAPGAKNVARPPLSGRLVARNALEVVSRDSNL